MSNECPIGVYDSGVGGLTVVRWLREVLPKERIIYFGDTARVPYGGRPREEIILFSRQILSFFVQRGVKFVIAACNTSSALALPALVATSPIPLMGVIEAGARAALANLQGDKIGVIATESTVESKAYSNALRNSNPSVEVLEIPCPALVPLVERGEWEGERVEALLRGYLQVLQGAKIDSLVLGCTHYPFLLPVIRRILGKEVAIIDPGEEAATMASTLLKEMGLLAQGQGGPAGPPEFYVSGDPQAFARAAAGLGYDSVVKAVDIGQYGD